MTFLPSFADLLLLARASDIAYQRDAAAAASELEALGLGFIAQVTNGAGGKDQGDCQALVATWPHPEGERTLWIFRGTEVTGHFSAPELADNVLLHAIRLGGGIEAAAGYFQDVAALWPFLARQARRGPLVITGHSLGGARAELAALFAYALDPAFRVVSFGSPASANQAYWDAAFPAGTSLLRVIAGHDFAPEHGTRVGWTHRDEPFLWLKDGAAALATDRPGIDLSLADHSISGSYVPRLTALAGATPAGATTTVR